MKISFFLRAMAIVAISVQTAVSQQAAEPLKVLSATPTGTTATRDQTRAIVVMFNKPMVALQAVPADEASGPLLIEPQIKGKYRWLGTTTLTFWPTDTLPYATAYRARVPAGTKALDGSTLSQDYVWTFETPRPQLMRTDPYRNKEFVRPESPIFLQFNQPMDPGTARPFISLLKIVSDQMSPLDFTLRYPDGKELDKFGWDNIMKNVLIIVPSAKLDIESRYSVVLKAGLPGAVGNLGLASPQEVSFKTYNKFRFLGLAGEVIQPEGRLELKFSNPLEMKELVSHIAFQPGIEIPTGYTEGYYGNQTTPDLYLSFLPDTTYKLTIDKGLKDIFGNSLDTTIETAFSVSSYLPRLYMAGGEGTVEAYGKLLYPIAVRNIDTLRLSMTSVPVDGVIPYFVNHTYPNWTLDRLIAVHKKRNVLGHITFRVDEPFGGKKYGFTFAQVSAAAPKVNDYAPQQAFLQVTNLGITGKFSPENNLIWVTHLKDTGPVSGAEVQVRDDENRVLWTGRTDAEGLVRTPGWGALGVKPREWQQPRLWIFAKEGDDIAFTRNEEGTGIDPWRFGIDYDWRPQYQEMNGTIFTDRGLYRAGEEVQIKGIIRQRASDDWSIQNGKTVYLVITDPMNENVFSDTLNLSEYGSFSATFRMKSTAHLGDYRVNALVKKTGMEYAQYYNYYDDESRQRPKDLMSAASGGFRVEAFRPAESEVNVRFLSESYIKGDTVSANISARYLFGAPMRNDKVSWKLRAFPRNFSPEGFEGYSFGPSWRDRNRGEVLLNSADTTLNAEGILSVKYPVGVRRLNGTHDLLLEATTTSPSRRSVTGRASAILHGGQFYIGIRESEFFNQLGDTLRYDVVAVKPDGRVTPGRSIKVSIVKRQWISVRRAETDGRYYWQTDVLDSTVQQFSMTSGDSTTRFEYIPKHTGYYLINAASTDELGNSIRSGNQFYVTGSGYVAWQRSDDDRIELVADRTSYKPGDVAHVMVKSPYEKARALVTLERDGIIDQWTTELVGSAPEVTIPITRRHLPNIFVSVVLLQGRVAAEDVTNRGEDVGRPSFKIGYVNLPVDAGTRHLDVAVGTDMQEYHPGDSVHVFLNVQDANGYGAKSEVVVSVADMGVLNLINYVMPDPFDTFFGPRALAVMTSETIVHLIQQRSYGEKGEDEGGGGMSLSEIQMRGDFRYTAYWNPSVMTDDSGRAMVAFKLPDNLSQFKVMAVAQTKKSEFGYGSSTFRVNKEFLLQGALPRFARIGDRFSAGVVATNYSAIQDTVELLATVEKDIRMTGSGRVRFALEPGESREVRFNYVADKQVGSAKFNFQATMGRFSDGLTLTIPVEVPRMKESVALYESTVDSASQAIIIPKNIFGDLGGIQLTAASTALSGLENSVDYLFTYPYGCLEQRLSCVLPIILGEQMVRAFNLPALEGKDMRKVAQSVIDEIPQFQTSDGGYGYWKGSPFSYTYLTGYAILVMGKAIERGYKVDQTSLSNAIEYSRRFLRESKNQGYFPWNEKCYLATRAIIVYALTTVGRPEPAYMEQLYAERAKLPLFAKAFLLEAIHRIALNNPAMLGMQNDLVRELMNMAKVASTTAHFEEPDWEGLQWVFSTNTRTTAIILQALLETGNRDPFLSRVVSWLMREQKVGRWRSTQENVYVVAALSDYFSAFESETPDFKAQITVAGKKILDSVFKGRSFNTVNEEASLNSFQQNKELPIEIVKTGAGRLYYGIRMNYYPTRDTLTRDEGIAVLKTITTVDNKPVPKSPDGEYLLSAGSMYKVNLSVVVPQERNFVVVDDPVPAGTETVNLTFQTESNYLAAGLSGNNDDRYSYWWGGFNHVEQKDDRVLLFASSLPAGVHTHSYLVRAATYGSFGLPPTHAEEMYAPDVFGQTAAGYVIVK